MPRVTRTSPPGAPRGYTLDLVTVDGNLTLEERHIDCTLQVTGAHTITLPGGLREGFHCTIEQSSSSAVTFQAGDRATLVSLGDATQSGGQYSLCAVYVRSKSNPKAAEWLLAGTLA